MDYNFIERKSAFSDMGLNEFGIEWYDDEGELIGTDWYATEDERNEAVDHWYADQDEFTPEQ